MKTVEKRSGLPVAEGDAPLGEIVGGQLHGDAVAGQDADAVSPQPSGQVRQNHAVMLQLHAEQTAGKLFQNNSGNFDIIFFTHSTFRFLTPCPARQTGCRSELATGSPGPFPLVWSGSHGDVCSLQTLGTARHFELNSGTFVQTSIALRLNRGEVYEYVFTVFSLNEAIPFGCVKPLHCTFFFHLCFLCSVMRIPYTPVLSLKTKIGSRPACTDNTFKYPLNRIHVSNPLTMFTFHLVF